MSQIQNSSPQFQINKIRVSRTSGLALRLENFSAGLNIVRGENSSGRTTLLKLFEFGLGSGNIKRNDFIPEIKQCEKVVLEVNLKGELYTIERTFLSSNYVEVYHGGIDDFPRSHSTKFSAGQDISGFLLNKLGVPSVTIIDEFTQKQKSISFEDVYDILYLDQAVGFSKIHARLSNSQRINVFKLLAKISTPKIYQLLLDIESLKRRKQALHDDFDAIERFFGEMKLMMPREIQLKTEELIQQKTTFNSSLEEVRRQLRADPDYADPARAEILQLEQMLDQHIQEQYYAMQTLNDYITLENSLLADLDKSERMQLSAELLSTFEFTQCPRCLQSITEEMKSREIHGDCSLCARTLLDDVENNHGVEIYKSQIESQLEELADLQQQYQSRIDSLSTTIEQTEKTLSKKRSEFDEAIQQFIAPVIRNIEIITDELSSIDKELQLLEEQRKWRTKIQSMRQDLNHIESQIETLKKTVQLMQEEENSAKSKLVHIENFFRQFIEDIYPDEVSKVVLNKKTFLPEINGHRYNAKSATEKNIAILGYHFALLKFSIEFDSYIPKFLVIDTLRQDDLEEDIYQGVLRKFKDLSDVYASELQIFMVVRESFVDFLGYEKVQLTGASRLLTI